MKIWIRVVLLAILSHSSLLTFAQEIKITEVKENKFPSYTGKLIARDPNGISLDRVKFSEGDSLLTVSISDSSSVNVNYKKQEVLFLVLNHQGYDNRTTWYKNVIKLAIEAELIDAGDRYAIQSFDCNRPEYGEQKQLLYPSKPELVGEKDKLLDQLQAIDQGLPQLTSNCRTSTQIYDAIYTALEEFNKLPMDEGVTRSIVVFADDFSIVSGITAENIVSRSKEFNIPIYGITYHQILNRKYGVETICNSTFGSYYRNEKNIDSDAANTLLTMCGEMKERASGKEYTFEFDSPFDKDGKPHGVQVTYNNEVSAFSYNSPKLSFMEWVQANPLTSGLVGVGILLLIIILLVLRKKNRKAKALQEEEHQREIERLESEQESAKQKAQKQEEELNRIKDAERRKEEEAREADRKAKQDAENAEKLIQMKSRGNLPWFTYDYQGQHGSFDVNYPEFTIGRGEDNSYTINLSFISKNHLKVTFDAGVYHVEDLNSSNGTFVNGQRVSSCQLKHGDVVSIGDVHLTFHI